MKSKILLSLLVIVVSVSMVVGGTMAYFTDREASSVSTFTTGRLDIGLVGNDGVSKGINLDISNLAPGDNTAIGKITLTNNGSLDLAFIGGLKLVGSAEQKALAKKLVIKEMSIRLIPRANSSKTPSYEEFMLEGVGAGPYAGGYSTPANYGLTAFTNVTGKVTLADWVGMGTGLTGVPQGFWKSALKPGWSWEYTFQFTFDESAGNTLQGMQMGLEFVVEAAQVKEGAVAQALGALGFPNTSTYIEIDRLISKINSQD